MSRPAKEDQSAIESPPQGVRTFITFLIFLHLFAVAVAVMARTGTVSGFRSALRTQTKISYYLHFLGMDLGYDFHLTRAMPDDFDHICDVVLSTPKGFRGDDAAIRSQRLETIKLMPEDTWPGARRRRYLMLGLHAASLAEREEYASLIPQAVTTGLLAQHGIKDGKHQFRCRMITPRRWGDSALTDAHDPMFYSNDYRADVVASDPGQWSLVKVVSEGEATQLQGDRRISPTNGSTNSQGGR